MRSRAGTDAHDHFLRTDQCVEGRHPPAFAIDTSAPFWSKSLTISTEPPVAAAWRRVSLQPDIENPAYLALGLAQPFFDRRTSQQRWLGKAAGTHRRAVTQEWRRFHGYPDRSGKFTFQPKRRSASRSTWAMRHDDHCSRIRQGKLGALEMLPRGPFWQNRQRLPAARPSFAWLCLAREPGPIVREPIPCLLHRMASLRRSPSYSDADSLAERHARRLGPPLLLGLFSCLGRPSAPRQ